MTSPREAGVLAICLGLDAYTVSSPAQHRFGPVVRGYRWGSLGKRTDTACGRRAASPPAPAAGPAAMLPDGRDSSNALRRRRWDRRNAPPPEGVFRRTSFQLVRRSKRGRLLYGKKVPNDSQICEGWQVRNGTLLP